MRRIAGAVLAGLVLSVSAARAETPTYPGDALAGAAGPDHSFVASADFSVEQDDSSLTLGFRWYFMEQSMSADPVWIQDFLQKSSYAQVTRQGGPDSPPTFFKLTEIKGRYFLPSSPQPLYVEAGIGLGETAPGTDISAIGLGAGYYFNDTLAAKLRFMFGDIGAAPIDISAFKIGVETVFDVAGRQLWIDAAFSSEEITGIAKDSGLDINARYFINDDMYAGLVLETGTLIYMRGDKFAGTFGYSMVNGLDFEAAVGSQDNEPFLSAKVNYRF